MNFSLKKEYTKMIAIKIIAKITEAFSNDFENLNIIQSLFYPVITQNLLQKKQIPIIRRCAGCNLISIYNVNIWENYGRVYSLYLEINKITTSTICNSCLERLYPEIFQKIIEQRKACK
jgi:hypothetical protein